MTGTAPIEITEIRWGHIQLRHEGQLQVFKDCKVWPSGAKAWDWALTGTRHRPGIQPADLEELLAHDIEVMILSRGMELVLQTCPDTFSALTAAGIEYRHEETAAGVAVFNELTRAGRRVAGLFHSTC